MQLQDVSGSVWQQWRWRMPTGEPAVVQGHAHLQLLLMAAERYCIHASCEQFWRSAAPKHPSCSLSLTLLGVVSPMLQCPVIRNCDDSYSPTDCKCKASKQYFSLAANGRSCTVRCSASATHVYSAVQSAAWERSLIDATRSAMPVCAGWHVSNGTTDIHFWVQRSYQMLASCLRVGFKQHGAAHGTTAAILHSQSPTSCCPLLAVFPGTNRHNSQMRPEEH